MKTFIILFVFLCHISAGAQSIQAYQIPGLTVAVTNMEEMVSFYENVFDMEFQAISKYNSTLYEGNWGGFDMLFCPAEIAQNTATQNRHQFNVSVKHLQDFVHRVKEHGGTLMSDITEQDGLLSVGIYDPDGNSLVVNQSNQ